MSKISIKILILSFVVFSFSANANWYVFNRTQGELYFTYVNCSQASRPPARDLVYSCDSNQNKTIVIGSNSFVDLNPNPNTSGDFISIIGIKSTQRLFADISIPDKASWAVKCPFHGYPNPWPEFCLKEPITLGPAGSGMKQRSLMFTDIPSDKRLDSEFGTNYKLFMDYPFSDISSRDIGSRYNH